MATTGTYERWFEQDGERYHHVIDPRTELSADSDLLSSVSVISEDGFALRTVCLQRCLSKEKKLLCKDTEEDYQLVIVDQEGTGLLPPSLKGKFWAKHRKQHSYTYQYAS